MSRVDTNYLREKMNHAWTQVERLGRQNATEHTIDTLIELEYYLGASLKEAQRWLQLQKERLESQRGNEHE